MHRPSTALWSSAVMFGLIFGPIVRAQTAAADQPKKEEAYVLSVFEVTSKKDVGYRAGTTLAGTRTGEELKNVPQTITVLTNDFLKDIGSTDAFGAMKYATGGAYTPSSSFDVNSFLFRGIENAYQSRNFFIWYNPSDSFSTDRIDIVRGPNAILFGDADPGGMLNLNTKRAMFRDVTSVALRVGSWNQRRGTIDYNDQLNERFAVRLNLVYDEKDNWEHWVSQKRQGAHLAATWRPWSQTEVRVEGEYSVLDRRVPQTIPLDQFSLWNGTPFTFNTATAPTGTQRLSSATGANYWVWDQRVGALQNWRGFGQTGALSEAQSNAVKDTTIFPKGMHVFGPSYSHDFNYNTFTATVDQRVGDNLSLEFVANVTSDTNYRKQTTDNSIRRDPNQTMPGGAVNPNFGKYYLEYSWDARRAHHNIPEGRLNIVYDWSPVAWMRQRVFASAGLREEVFNNSVQREVILNNPTALPFNNQALLVRRRVYLEPGDGVANTGTIDPINDAATGLQAGFLTTQNAAINTTYTANAQLNASGEYLNGKFRSLFGVRRDYARSYAQTGVRDATTGLINRSAAPKLLRFEGYNTSVTAGGIWQPSPHYTFFATAAESYRPTGFGNTLINGDPVGAQLGRGHEGGVRLDFADGKFYLQATVFQARQSNRGANLSTTVTTINSIWTNAAANTVRPDYANKATTGGTFDREAVESTGHEIEVWCNLVPGWTLQAGYGYADAETVETSNFTRAYIAQNLPDWKTTAATNATTASALNPLIASLENFMLTAVPGSKSIGSSRSSYSLFTKYTVQSGAWKNVEFGLGLNHRSGPVVYNDASSGAVRPFYGESSTVVNLLLGYSRKLTKKIRWNISLNIQNALDDEYLIELSRSQVTYGDPRSWALTNTFTF